MSQEQVEIVQSAFDAWERGDVDAILELCDEGIVVIQPPELPGVPPRQHGHAGVREAFAFSFSYRKIAAWRIFVREAEALEAARLG